MPKVVDTQSPIEVALRSRVHKRVRDARLAHWLKVYCAFSTKEKEQFELYMLELMQAVGSLGGSLGVVGAFELLFCLLEYSLERDGRAIARLAREAGMGVDRLVKLRKDGFE